MKWSTVVIFVVLIYLLGVTCLNCSPGEYNPGPDCGLEPSCPSRYSRAYPKSTCDCWCLPDTYRILETNTCVPLNGCNDY